MWQQLKSSNLTGTTWAKVAGSAARRSVVKQAVRYMIGMVGVGVVVDICYRIRLCLEEKTFA